MMMIMRRIEQYLVLGACLAALSAGSATPDKPVPTNAPNPSAKAKRDLFADDLVAKGKGFAIKRSQLDDEVIRVKSQAASRNQPLPPEQVAMMEQQILDQLIQIQLLLAKATDADKATGKTMAETKFEEAKTKVGSEENLNRRLKAEGLTKEDLLSKWTEAATAEAVAKRDLNVNVTDEDVKKFYDENPAKFEQPEMVRASHILLSTKDTATNTELPEDKKAAKKKLAEDLVKRARAGEDFAKLAKEFSEDPGSKDNGGEYTFPHGKMVAEFDAAAFSLKTNQVSDVVTTEFGFHVIKLLEKMPAKKVELAKVSSDIKEYLGQQAMAKQVPDYMAKLKQEASVEYLDEKLKPRERPQSAPNPALLTPVKPVKPNK
jgi:peptidyl-prolyl cis-trans isomerase C